MENENRGISVPLTGWMVFDLGSWRVDPSIRIVTGVRLEPEAFPDVEIKLEGDVSIDLPMCVGQFYKEVG